MNRLSHVLLCVASAVVTAGAGLVAPAPAVAGEESYAVSPSGGLPVVGNGYGHGRGMSQWGAEYRARAGQSLSTILGFYYPGTTAFSQGNPTIRVALTNEGKEGATSGANRFGCDYAAPAGDRRNCGFTMVAQPSLRVAALAPSPVTFVAAPTSLAGRAVIRWGLRPTADRTKVELMALTADNVWRVCGAACPAANATGFSFNRTGSAGNTVRMRYLDGTERDYAGSIQVRRLGPTAIARVNVVGMETYLRGVVPSEVFTSWLPTTLQAQAVAARTYASWNIKYPHSVHFHTCDSISCQVYSGTARTVASTDAAIAATAGHVRRYGGAPAFTEFSASNGGWSVDTSLPYIEARADPLDVAHRHWSATVTGAQLRALAGSAVGTVRRVVVTARTGKGEWGGRVLSLRLEGTTGSRTVTGDQLRTGAGLRSTYLTFLPDGHDRFGAAASGTGADLVTRAVAGQILYRSWTPDGGLGPATYLGGVTSAAPALVRSPSSRLDAFVVGMNGQLYQTVRSSTAAAWTGWVSRGGAVSGRPAAVMPSAGQLTVYARAGDGRIARRAGSTSGSWGAWQSIGAAKAVPAGAGLAAVVPGDGTERILYRGSDRALWMLTRVSSSGRLSVQRLGGQLIGDPTVAASGSGTFVVLVRGTNNGLFAMDVEAGRAGAWRNLGGVLGSSPVAAGVPSTGRVSVLVNGSTGPLFRIVRTGTTWGSWALVG